MSLVRFFLRRWPVAVDRNVLNTRRDLGLLSHVQPGDGVAETVRWWTEHQRWWHSPSSRAFVTPE